MASVQSTTPSNEKEWRKVLRAFHLTGHGAVSESESQPESPLWPALASKLENDHRLAANYPLILPSSTDTSEETEPVSLLHVLESLPLDAGSQSASTTEDLERIVRKAETIIAESSSREISEIVAKVMEEISSENEDEVSASGLRDCLARLPDSGRLVGFGRETLPLLYSWAAEAQWHSREIRFREEIKELIVGLEAELLNREQQQNPQSLAKTMGEEANIFVDLEKLSRNLPPVGGFENHLEARLELLRETLAVLQTYLESETRSLPFYLFSSREVPGFPELPAESTFITKNCFEAALEFVDGLLQRMSRVFRAVRVARLIVSGHYQPELHDEAFSRFQWQSCNREEILLVPRVLIVESSASVKIEGNSASLSRLLRSGRPVHVLITQDVSGLAAEELSGALEDLSANALACREALVLQSTLAQPDHLLSGLGEMVQTVCPSIAFVSVHPTSQQGNWDWASELLSHYGRVAPCFRFSPDLGPSWSDRLDISGNPQPEAGQPVVKLACTSLPAAAKQIDESVTFAHAAALRPEFRNHFKVIPSFAWSDDQQPIGAYLDEFKSTPPASLPYIWIVREEELCRAIMTREMANACRDRCIAWRGLQELAGMNSAFKNKTREDVQSELEARYQNETENARAKGIEEGTVQAVNRIVQALLGPKTPVTNEQ